MRLEEFLRCVGGGLRSIAGELRGLLVAALQESRLLSWEPWCSLEWQRAKYLIARVLARCACQLGCHAYLLELHGGEPSVGSGDKDIDLVLDCPQALPEGLEERLEALVEEVLGELLGGDALEKLRIPNIVELHAPSEFLISRHLHASGQRYAIKLC